MSLGQTDLAMEYETLLLPLEEAQGRSQVQQKLPGQPIFRERAFAKPKKLSHPLGLTLGINRGGSDHFGRQVGYSRTLVGNHPWQIPKEERVRRKPLLVSSSTLSYVATCLASMALVLLPHFFFFPRAVPSGSRQSSCILSEHSQRTDPE